MSRRKKIICVLIILLISGVGLFDNTDVVYAGCTKTCDKCNGLGTFGNSASASGTVNGFSYNSYVKTEGCWNCGGSGTKTVYYASSSPGSGQSYTSGSYTKGTGVIATSCTYPSKYSYTSGKDDSSGVTYSDGVRYKNCTVCGTRLETAYKVVVEAGTGIASVSGGGYYNAGALVSYSCTVSTGYTFSKWSDGDTRQSWTSGNGLHCPRYYKATAIPISYTQTTNHYIWNPDTSKWDYWTKTTTSANYDSTFKPSYTTTPTGYYNYSIDYKDGWKVTGAGTFCAYYYPNTYTITYDANGGTGAPANESFLYNSTYSIASSIPTRRGYTFVNWYVVENGQYLTAGQQRPKTWGSFTLKAQWTPNQYELTISPNGGRFMDGTETAQTTSPNLTYDAMSWWHVGSYMPTRTGYTFTGFYDALSGGTKVYDSTGTCVPETKYWTKEKKYAYDGNLAVYAQWKQNEYTVTYNANGGETVTQTRRFHYDEEVDLSLSAQKDGKIFVGWSTKPDATTAIHKLVMPDLESSENPDYADWELTLYAVYSIPVSDVANHNYPDYEEIKKKEWEVFVRIYDCNDETNYKDYKLSYISDSGTMTYRYKLEEDISEFVKDMEQYYYKVYAYDNAENGRVIYENIVSKTNDTEPLPEIPEREDPIPNKYQQTVEYYKYNPITDNYIKFTDDIRVEIEENRLFTPEFLLPPDGYEPEYMEYPNGYQEAGKIKNGSYIVTEAANNKAYYKASIYELTFDANGGTMEVKNTSKNKITGKVTYNDHYGMVGFDFDGDGVYRDRFGFPTPEREGYTFDGWYTKETGDEQIEAADIYMIADDSTLYAQWKKNEYVVIYDFVTNGGVEASVIQNVYHYGDEIELNSIAKKKENGWEFVGWNIDPNATVVLNENSRYICKECQKIHEISSMPAHDVVLYAIYKKDISVIVKERGISGLVESKLVKTVYNQEMIADFVITSNLLETELWPGWKLQGWTTETGATDPAFIGIGSTYSASEDTILYGVYTSEVSLAYDTNGALISSEPVKKECFYNVSGDSKFPKYIVSGAPVRKDCSFVNWKLYCGKIVDNYDNSINVTFPKEEITVLEDTVLQAVWDKYPVIEAYDRYFTLDQAQKGEITEEKLLERVSAKDEEARTVENPEGLLVNGKDVIVMNYNSLDFTNGTGNEKLSVTYEATDSFGNIVTKKVTIHITDSTMKKVTKKAYVRFISAEFLLDDTGKLISSEKGGLEDTSIWRTNPYYQKLLRETVTYENIKERETWVFTKKDIKEMKSYTDIYGHVQKALEEFFAIFEKCRVG